MTGNYYVFNILLPTDTGEIESIRNFTVSPVYTAGFAYSGATTLSCTSFSWVNPSILYSSGCVALSTTWYDNSRASQYMTVSGSYTFDMRFYSRATTNVSTPT